jgi:hypothetical protein
MCLVWTGGRRGAGMLDQVADQTGVHLRPDDGGLPSLRRVLPEGRPDGALKGSASGEPRKKQKSSPRVTLRGGGLLYGGEQGRKPSDRGKPQTRAFQVFRNLGRSVSADGNLLIERAPSAQPVPKPARFASVVFSSSCAFLSGTAMKGVECEHESAGRGGLETFRSDIASHHLPTEACTDFERAVTARAFKGAGRHHVAKKWPVLAADGNSFGRASKATVRCVRQSHTGLDQVECCLAARNEPWNVS